jgi:hypothetical protein
MRERRRRVALAIVALAALVVAGLLGRLTAPTAEPSPPRDSRSINSSPRAHDTRTVAGVRVGYPRTREGAVAAMAAYGHALADPRVQLDDHLRAKVAAAVGTERYVRTLEQARSVFAALRAGSVGQALRPGARAVFLGVPIAYRILSYGGANAVIRSWGVAITASDTGLRPEATWTTTTTTAVWEDGRWKVDRVSSTPGPTPAGPRSTWQAIDFLEALTGMRGFSDAP